MLSDKQVKIFKNDSRKKVVDVKNIEPINNIQIIREKESDLSSESDSSESLSDSELSEISKYNEKNSKKTSSKNISKNKVNKHKFQEPPRNNDFSSFSNPKKINKKVESEYSESEYSSSSIDEYSDDSGSDVSGGSDNEKAKWEEKQKLKQDLLIKIQSLENKGFEFSKKFNMNSNYEEMKFEYDKVKHFIESQAAIKFSRRCLMACVTGIEFLNKKFDPFNIKLEGWSENVMESVNDYDNIFERLHEKYSHKAEIAPEIELLLTLGGSAFMYHLTNSLLKGNSMNPLAPNNPNFMQSMMGALNQSMNQMNQVRSTTQVDEYSSPPPPNVNPMNFPKSGPPPKPIETRGIRKEMRGPTIDQNLFAGTPLMSNYPKPPAPVDYPQNNQNNNEIIEDDRFSLASSDSSLSSVSTVEKKITFNSMKKNTKTKKSNGSGFELNIN